MDERSTTSLPGNYARGLAMGTADLVPGVSGGTMALITGIYERLVAVVRAVTGLLLDVLQLNFIGLKERARSAEWTLLVPVLAGMLTAIAAGATFLPTLLEDYPVETKAVFFGLIFASIPIPWRELEERKGREYLIAAVAAALTFVLVGLPESNIADPSAIVILATAAIAICAMVLPGISGSFLLLILGTYEATLDAVHERDLAYIAVFALGAVIGLTLFSRVLVWLLEHWHAVTMAALTGLMAGSLRALWPWGGDERALTAPPSDGGEILVVVALALAGAAIVTILLLGARRVRAGER